MVELVAKRMPDTLTSRSSKTDSLLNRLPENVTSADPSLAGTVLGFQLLALVQLSVAPPRSQTCAIAEAPCSTATAAAVRIFARRQPCVGFMLPPGPMPRRAC